MTDFVKTAVSISDMALAMGADEAEGFISQGSETNIRSYHGKVELFNESEGLGMGVRVFKEKRLGYAFSTRLDERCLKETVGKAIENAKISQPDMYNGLPAKGAVIPADMDLELLSDKFETASSADKIEFLLSMEERAAASDARIKDVDEAVYVDSKGTVYLANSNGFSGNYTSGTCYGFLSVLAEENGKTENGFSIRSGHFLEELDGNAAADEASKRALMLLGAESMKPKKTTVVFDPLSFVQVLGYVAMALNADAAQKGRSFLARLRENMVAPEWFTLVDDGRMVGGLGSAPFDDEGVATQRTPVIDKGRLSTFLYNTYSAAKEGRTSTGNASRGSFKTPPGTSPTNLFVSPGSKTPDDIISGIDDGLYVINLQGLHAGVSAITGQFSVGAGGMVIENGRLARPVREITIASTLKDMLAGMLDAGSDLTFFSMGGSIGSPTVAVQGMTVSGR